MRNNIIQYILALPFSLRQKRLAQTRIPLTQDEFVQRITSQGGDNDTAIILWNKLQDWTYVDSFTPYPEDKLGWVFGIDEEELDEDLILDILKSQNMPIPDREFVGFGIACFYAAFAIGIYLLRLRHSR